MGKRILIIDDEPDIRDYLAAVLEDHGYVTHGVNEKQSIPEAVTACRPDLIILDVVMPIKDGFTVCEQLKGNPETASIPVFMLTGFREQGGGTSVATSQGMSMEAEDYIEKPFNATDLLERVERRLKKMGF